MDEEERGYNKEGGMISTLCCYYGTSGNCLDRYTCSLLTSEDEMLGPHLTDDG